MLKTVPRAGTADMSGNLVVDVAVCVVPERLFCAAFGLPSVCLAIGIRWVG